MKVMVVDDSIVFRSGISSVISENPEWEVVKSLSNGKLAVEAARNFPDIDCIILDLEMPVMDGLTAISEIRKFNTSVVIIVFSSLTTKGVEKTFEALHAGANDFVTKPEANEVLSGDQYIRQELLPKLKAFKERLKTASLIPAPLPVLPARTAGLNQIDLLIIGSSTGGPDVLGKIFKNITCELKIPVLIVQHMPPMFTEKLAETLDKFSPVKVLEAKDGLSLQPNHAYIAPGDWHMTLEKNIIRLNQDEKVCFVRPSVDVLLFSLAPADNSRTAVCILTGMGEDGAAGSVALKNKGASIYIQDKNSSVVWGMPGAVYRQVPGAETVELENIAPLIMKMAC